MGSTKLTERALVPLLKPNASALITQLEGSAGSEIESLRRISAHRLIAAAFPDDSISENVAIFSDGADNMPLKALTLRYSPVQAGSGVPSPDNVRAISGWTGATVIRARKNLLPLTMTSPDTYKGVTFTVNDDGTVSFSGTTENVDIMFALGTLTLPTGSYILTGAISSTHRLRVYNADTQELLGHDTGSGYTITLTAPTRITVQARIGSTVGDSVSGTFSPMIRPASVENAVFEPFLGEIYTIDWQDEAGTVYGGTLDVLSGILTVDRVMFTIDGDSTLSTLDTSSDNFNRVTYAPYSSIGVSNISFDCCDMFECIAPRVTAGLYKVWNSTSASSPRMFFGLPKTVTTLDAAKAWFALNETHIVAQIASPQTYQLTPADVRTLLGDNIISANTDDMDLTYCADPNLYIERKISEAVADCASVHADANTLTLATTE